MAEILMAAQSAAVSMDGIPHMIEAGRTLAHADHAIVTACPSLWQPLRVHYSTDIPEAVGSEAPEPDAKDVRAWAAENGIEVSPKGKLPAGVIEQYQAAHTEA
ncbi:Lsr2 family DNA-binding protein [Streptomyces sp. NPDC004262]